MTAFIASFRRLVPPVRMLAVTALLVSSAVATTHAYQVDQENTATPNLSWNLHDLAPIGQSFVPAASVMNVVELDLGTTGSFITLASFTVRVRADSMSGPVLATSDTLRLPGPSRALRRFTFTPPLDVTPGREHVLEVLWIGGTTTMLAYGNTVAVPGDREAWVSGVPDAQAALWFRTGYDNELPTERRSWGEIKSRWR